LIPEVKQRPVDLQGGDSPLSVDQPVIHGRENTGTDRWRLLGKLAPAIVFAWMALDLLSRFLNPALFQLDPWLVVSRCPPRYSPFSRDQSFYLQSYIGGNARAANIPPTEIGGPLTFSTDHLGFRKNPYLKEGQAPQVLFLQGDSFTYGVGLSDEQTLPSVMTAKFHIPSYNSGRFHDDPDGMPELDWLLSHLPGRPTTIVYTYLEHLPFIAPGEMGGPSGRLRRWSPKIEGDLRYLKLLNTFFWELSPSRVVTTRFFNKLANDRFFPNENTSTVRALALPDGRELLFRDYEFQLPEQDRGPDAVAQTTRGFQWLKSEMEKRQIRLIVLLLPNRYTIYAPLLAKNTDGPWTNYLDQLDAQLHQNGIETVNGLEVYRSFANQEIQTGQLSFYREDTHWNPRGVERIAGPLADAIARHQSVSADGNMSHVIQ
jgi:hypothetical protein